MTTSPRTLSIEGVPGWMLMRKSKPDAGAERKVDEKGCSPLCPKSTSGSTRTTSW